MFFFLSQLKVLYNTNMHLYNMINRNVKYITINHNMRPYNMIINKIIIRVCIS